MKMQIKALSDKIGREIPLPYYATAGAAAIDAAYRGKAPITPPSGGIRRISK